MTSSEAKIKKGFLKMKKHFIRKYKFQGMYSDTKRKEFEV